MNGRINRLLQYVRTEKDISAIQSYPVALVLGRLKSCQSGYFEKKPGTGKMSLNVQSTLMPLFHQTVCRPLILSSCSIASTTAGEMC